MIELHPHQRDAIHKMHDGCVLWGGVGTGKTIAALSYYMENHSEKDIYIITTARKRDLFEWEGDAHKVNVNVQYITVDSWNRISDYDEIENAFFIFDEQRLVGTGAWVKSFYKIAKNNKWILLTATPGDNWLDYVPIFIANGYFRNITEFRQNHVIYKRFGAYPVVDRYAGEAKLMRLRREILVEMPVVKHTVRHVEMVEVDFDQEMFKTLWKRRWHVYEDRPIKDAGELFRVGRKLVATHHSRMKALGDLMERHKRIIIFYTFDYELDQLRKLGEIRPLAEWNGHKHENIPAKDEWIYLVQYTSGAEGWNCTTTDSMVFWSMTYSYKLFEQAQGRIDRMNTPYVDLYYYVLTTKSIVDRAVWRALKAKRDFNLKGFKL